MNGERLDTIHNPHQYNPPADQKQEITGVVLVTGGNGFLGLAISNTLAKRYRVVCLDLARGSLQEADFVSCDISSDGSVAQAMAEINRRYGKQIASVVHPAGYYDFTGEPSPLYEKINVKRTKTLERPAGVSSGAVHLCQHDARACADRTWSADWPLRPKWAYPQSRLQTELPYRAYTAPLRIAGVYTDRAQPPTLSHQIQRIYEKQFANRVFVGDISHGQAFVHIDDLTEAIARLVDR